MAHELLANEVQMFLKRFQDFHDAALRQVTLDFTRPRDWRARTVPRGVVITLSTLDFQESDEGELVNVVLDIEAVSKLALDEGNTTSVKLWGLSIGFFDGAVYLAIDAEAESREEFLQAEFHVVGERLVWSVESYREHMV